MKNKFALLFSLLAMNFLACSNDKGQAGGSTEAENSIAIVDKTIAGVSQKGPLVNGAKVQVFELEQNTLIQSGSVFKGSIVSDKGDFTVSHINLKSQYALLEATGPYYSELTGKITATPITLNALTDLSDRQNANINLLTHMEYGRALWLVHRDSLSVSEAKQKADEEILKAFVNEPIELVPEDLNIFGDGKANEALLAISVLMQLGLTESEFSKALADFVGDIEQDGSWDDSTARAFVADEAFAADLKEIRNNILSWGIAKEIPSFEKFVELFWNNAYGLPECTSEMEGAILPNVNALSKLYKSKFRCKDLHWELYEKFVEDESPNFTDYPTVEMDTIDKFTSLDCSNSMYCPKDCRHVMDPDVGRACSRVSTGLDDGSDTYGFIWPASDESSHFIWPAEDLGYGYEAASRDKYGYIYGIAELGDSESPWAIVGFNVSGVERQGNDITEWGGLCVVYSTEEDMMLSLHTPNDKNTTNYDYYQAKLPATQSIINADVSWDKFVQQGWGTPANREEIIKNVSQIHLRYNKPGIKSSFKIYTIGKIGTCQKE